MGLGLDLMIIAVMLMITAILAAYEMALASISKVKLTALVNMKRSGARDALYMKERMEGSLAVLQILFTLVTTISAAIGGVAVDEHLAPVLRNNWGLSHSAAGLVSLVFLIIPLSAITTVFAELVPKTYAIKHQVRVCLVLSPFMKGLAFFLNPVVSLLEGIVKKVIALLERNHALKEQTEDTGLHELNAAVALARTSRLLGVHEEKIVLSAAQLSRRSIKEIILPIEDVSTISLGSSLSEALILAHNDMHTRYPVCEEENNPQTIVGYVNFKDIIAALKLNPEDPRLKGIMRPIKTVPDSSPISQVFERMTSEKLHIIMVANSSGKLIGMVTLEDIIEELVGEIEDEFDRMPSYVHPYGDGGWIMGGGVLMSTFAKTVGASWPALSVDEEKLRLSDWCVLEAKNPLKTGQILEKNGFQIIVRKLRRKKLGEAIVNLRGLQR